MAELKIIEKVDLTLFSPKMKMSEMLLSNPSLVAMLPRFGIELGFGEKKVCEVCDKYGISTPFFLLVCNVYSHDEYLPNEEEIDSIDMTGLVPYLLASHKYYLEERISSIELKMKNISENCDPRYGSIIQKFFSVYKGEVINHFKYEEGTVFPYIKNLIKGEHQKTYNIEQYESNHSNIEDKLADLTNILIKYLPSNISQKDRISALSDIFSLSSDLKKHSLIEDKILVPYVEVLESNE